MPGYLLDTDVLIDVQRGHSPALAWFGKLPSLPSVPGFVVMELVQDARNRDEVCKALQLVAPLSIIWPTDADCRQALLHFASYHVSHGLGLLDSIIAACSIGIGAELCTFNVKHYQIIPGLLTVQPYVR